jgi:hypothetical protein
MALPAHPSNPGADEERRVAARQRPLAAHSRQVRALALRANGLSYEEIAAEVGWRSRSSAFEAVQAAMAAIQFEAVNELRFLEGLRLDQLQAAFWGRAIGGDTKAARVVLAVMERRARLFGLDGPVKETPMSTAQMDAEIDAMIDEIAELKLRKGWRPPGSESG